MVNAWHVEARLRHAEHSLLGSRVLFCCGSPRHCVSNLEALGYDVARLRAGDKRHYHSLKPVAFFPTIPRISVEFSTIMRTLHDRTYTAMSVG
jgi:hypothetical protein